MTNKFNYIIEKINDTPFQLFPFKHLIIDNFLEKTDFDEITNSDQINFPIQSSTESLIKTLSEKKYTSKAFPGCTTSIESYLNWYNQKDKNLKTFENGLVEGFGMAFRLKSYDNRLIDELVKFLNSKTFHDTIKDKFNKTGETTVETAIQKYMSGYEISPHPDIRKKCLTYMVNINTSNESENVDIHTYILNFKKEYECIKKFWETETTVDRCWVPWSWCDIKFTHSKNNSIIMFAPNNDTLHAVKLDYDHLKFQRTQIYGNLWYPKTNLPKTTWKDLIKKVQNV